MESEREKNLRRIFDLVERNAKPGFGYLISLGNEREKREARAAAKRARRLPQGPGPGRDMEPDSKE